MFGHGFCPNEIEDVIGASWQKTADGLDRVGLRGVNDIGRTKSFCSLQPLRLNVDHHDPRCTGEARTAYSVKADATGADNDNSIASADLSGVEDGAGPRHHAATEQ